MAPKPLIRAFLGLCAGFALLVGPSADAAKPGALDTTFGRAGKVITDFGRIDGINDIAVQPNGKIVVVGDSYGRGTANDTFALARYTRSGALDQTFGTGGKVTTSFGRPSTAAFAVALQADGRIVAAGGTSGGIALARYEANGSLDPTFGDGGRVVTDLHSHVQWASAIVIQPDGKLVVSGSTRQLGSYADFLVARYTASGALDQSFGNGGLVSTDFQPGWTDYAFGVALGPGSKIVAAGVGLPGDAGGPASSTSPSTTPMGTSTRASTQTGCSSARRRSTAGPGAESSRNPTARWSSAGTHGSSDTRPAAPSTARSASPETESRRQPAV